MIHPFWIRNYFAKEFERCLEPDDLPDVRRAVRHAVPVETPAQLHDAPHGALRAGHRVEPIEEPPAGRGAGRLAAAGKSISFFKIC
jgi:hypothetical protein